MNRRLSWKTVVPLAGLAVFLLFYPKWVDSYFLHLTIATFLAMIMASSWDILARTGQVSVGQAGLFGIGAYTAALLYQKVHLHPILGMLAGAILAMTVAIALGYLTLRLPGDLFFHYHHCLCGGPFGHLAHDAEGDRGRDGRFHSAPFRG